MGNLIALPLQGEALKKGNSAFVDKNWNAYPDQWDILLNHTKKLSLEDIESYMVKWKEEISGTTGIITENVADRPKPWKKKQTFHKADVAGIMHIVLGDSVYVDTLNLMPQIQNQIRSLAAFDNPVFYKNKRLGYSNYYNFSAIYMGKDIDGYICIPRGLRDTLIRNCEEAGIKYDIADQREKGRPIRVDFNGDLRMGQDLAADRMLQYDHGVLSATTAFGKTVVCSYLISQRKVNTLVYFKYMRAKITYVGMQRRERYFVPEAALRETLLNALCHSQYNYGVPIQISVYEDRMYIVNCGQLPDNWTVENLLGKHASRPYNPNIANVFYLAGFIESWGRGIEKICETCKADDLPAPEFTVNPGDIMVKFTAPEDRIVHGPGRATERVGVKVGVNLSEGERSILELLEIDPGMTYALLAKKLNVSEKTIYKRMKLLRDKKILVRIGTDKQGYWEIKE